MLLNSSLHALILYALHFKIFCTLYITLNLQTNITHVAYYNLIVMY